MTEPTETRWRCPTCGSDEVETLVWIRLNGGTISSWDDGGDYWCPQCETHHSALCEVTREGHCLMHDRPFTECLPKELESVELLSLPTTDDAVPHTDEQGGVP